jgi:tetratricopeptide (TPR) repeat protein
MGQWSKVLDVSRRGVALCEALADRYPDSPEYPDGMANSSLRMAAAYRALGQYDDAEKAVKRSVEIWDRLSKQRPGFYYYTMAQGEAYGQMGHVLRDRGKLEAAQDWYGRAVERLESVRQTTPGLAEPRRFLSESREGQALVLTALKKYPEALRDWDRALELATGTARERLRLGRAATLARQGDHVRAIGEARAITGGAGVGSDLLYAAAAVQALAAIAASRDERLPAPERDRLTEQYAAAAVGLLEKAAGAGFFALANRLDRLRKDADLESLRARDDFKKLLAGLPSPEKPK